MPQPERRIEWIHAAKGSPYLCLHSVWEVEQAHFNYVRSFSSSMVLDGMSIKDCTLFEPSDILEDGFAVREGFVCAKVLSGKFLGVKAMAEWRSNKQGFSAMALAITLAAYCSDPEYFRSIDLKSFSEHLPALMQEALRCRSRASPVQAQEEAAGAGVPVKAEATARASVPDGGGAPRLKRLRRSVPPESHGEGVIAGEGSAAHAESQEASLLSARIHLEACLAEGLQAEVSAAHAEGQALRDRCVEERWVAAELTAASRERQARDALEVHELRCEVSEARARLEEEAVMMELLRDSEVHAKLSEEHEVEIAQRWVAKHAQAEGHAALAHDMFTEELQCAQEQYCLEETLAREAKEAEAEVRAHSWATEEALWAAEAEAAAAQKCMTSPAAVASGSGGSRTCKSAMDGRPMRPEDLAALASRYWELDQRMMLEMQQVHSCTSAAYAEVPGLPHVVIANLGFAKSLVTLQSIGVRFILTLNPFDGGRGMQPSIYARMGIKEHRFLDFEDTPTFDVLEHLDEALAFLDKARDEKAKVLVHCDSGVNRAGTVVVAYMMRQACKAGPRRIVRGHEALRVAWDSLANVYWPVLQQASFRLQLSLWADTGYSLVRCRDHCLHPVLIFRCAIVPRVQARLNVSELGATESEQGQALESIVEHIMHKEANLPRPWRISTLEEQGAASYRIADWLQRKYT